MCPTKWVLDSCGQVFDPLFCYNVFMKIKVDQQAQTRYLSIALLLFSIGILLVSMSNQFGYEFTGVVFLIVSAALNGLVVRSKSQ